MVSRGSVRLPFCRPQPELPAQVAADLKASFVRPLPGGGSSAYTWYVQTRDGRRVVKALWEMPGQVESHTLENFLTKPVQIGMLAKLRPEVARLYPPILRVWAGDGWAALAMPHRAGRPLAEFRHAPEAFRSHMRSVYGFLINDGYQDPVCTGSPDHFAQTHVARLENREGLLRAHLDQRLFDSSELPVNGSPCRSVTAALDALQARAVDRARLTPAHLYPPLHGDLNLGNVLVGREVVLLDPRGTTLPWDPVYDFAKSLFSLTCFEDAMRTGFRIETRSSARGAGYAVHVEHDRAAADVARTFVGDLIELCGARGLCRDDAGWLARLAVVHAVHYIAESACRLSDPKYRRLPAAAGPQASVHLAFGLYLAGRWLLHDLANRPPSGSWRLEDHLTRFFDAFSLTPQTRG